MPSEAGSTSPEINLRDQVKAEQVRLSIDQVRRIPLTHFLVDICIAWSAWLAGVGSAAWIWLALMTFSQVGRSVYIIRLDRQGRLTPSQMLTRLSVLLVLLGAIHAVMICMVFSRPLGDQHYILTMIMVGIAAGAVSPAAGNVWSYLGWAVVFGGTLAAAWATQDTPQSYAIAVLVVLLLYILTLYVRDQGRAQADLVRLSDSLRRERDRAERASEAKTRFFAAASHDLRQPLTVISIHAKTVHELARQNEDELLATVAEGIDRGLADSSALLDSLLEISKLDAGAVRPAFQHADVVPLVAKLCETYIPQAQEKDLELRFLDSEEKPIVARTDPALLQRILRNLVENALKFTIQGSVSMEAMTVKENGETRAVISVTDTGSGIAASDQERIFEEFCQIGNPERNRTRGLGLGLSIVSRLAALLDARVWVHSEPGQGATFGISLPCGQIEGSRAAPAGDLVRPPIGKPVRGASFDVSPARRPSADSFTTPGAGPALVQDSAPADRKRVLILDDESEIRRALEILLRKWGWSVLTAATHDEAVGAWNPESPLDVLVFDFRLQAGASGLETLNVLRAMGCSAPAILITGDTEPSRIEAARAAGIPVLYKPVTGSELATALQSAIDTGNRGAARGSDAVANRRAPAPG